jgi:hypothetical protein
VQLNPSKFLASTLLGCLLITANAYAGVYKWVDSNGGVHYSDQPNPSPGTKQLNLPPSPTSPVSADSNDSGPKSLADKEMEFRKRRAAAEEAQKKAEQAQKDAKQKEANCAQAKSNLGLLQQGGRVATVNEKGERVYLDDQGRQNAIDRAKADVNTWCK